MRNISNTRAVTIGKEQIHHRHIGFGAVQACQCFGHGAGLPHDFSVRLCTTSSMVGVLATFDSVNVGWKQRFP